MRLYTTPERVPKKYHIYIYIISYEETQKTVSSNVQIKNTHTNSLRTLKKNKKKHDMLLQIRFTAP